MIYSLSIFKNNKLGEWHIKATHSPATEFISLLP